MCGQAPKRPVILGLGTELRAEFHRNRSAILVLTAHSSAFPDHYDDNRRAMRNQ